MSESSQARQSEVGVGGDRIVVTDGAGDRYQVVDYDATFTLKSLNRPEDPPMKVASSTLRKLGIEWNGRTLKAVG